MTTRVEVPATEGAGGLELDALEPLEIAAAMVRAEAAIPAALEPELPAVAAAIDTIAARLRAGGRLIMAGAGTSGRLCLLQASELGPTFGLGEERVIGLLAGARGRENPHNLLLTPPEAEDDSGAGAATIHELEVTNGDAVVAVAASGATPWTVAALEAAVGRGALGIAVACTHPSALESVATMAIHPSLGPELLAGSTRLVAASACKVVLDILTTGAMVRLGRVYRDRMVDVEASNQKLRDRAVRIVADLAGQPDQDARVALESVGWWARAAIVRLKLGLDPDEARMWAATHPQLGDALRERRGR
jgi:N-acetylmuramic acid 6-phosphate etherase